MKVLDLTSQLSVKDNFQSGIDKQSNLTSRRNNFQNKNINSIRLLTLLHIFDLIFNSVDSFPSKHVHTHQLQFNSQLLDTLTKHDNEGIFPKQYLQSFRVVFSKDNSENWREGQSCPPRFYLAFGIN